MNTDSQHLQQVSEEFQHMVEEFFSGAVALLRRNQGDSDEARNP